MSGTGFLHLMSEEASRNIFFAGLSKRRGVTSNFTFRSLLKNDQLFYAYMENRKLLGDERILYILDELSGLLKYFRIKEDAAYEAGLLESHG